MTAIKIVFPDLSLFFIIFKKNIVLHKNYFAFSRMIVYTIAEGEFLRLLLYCLHVIKKKNIKPLLLVFILPIGSCRMKEITCQESIFPVAPQK